MGDAPKEIKLRHIGNCLMPPIRPMAKGSLTPVGISPRQSYAGHDSAN